MRRPTVVGMALLIWSLVFSAVVPAAPAATSSLAPGRKTVSIPADFFGMHLHRVASTTAWPTPSFGAWRLWDCYASWRDLEPQKGLWDFSRLDRYVQLAGASNVELQLPLAAPPRWASARPDEPSAYGPGSAAEPAQMDDWRDYVRTVATRYKGKIRYYEIWNEPNLKLFYTGTVAGMIDLVNEAVAIIREVDPDARIISPSPEGVQGIGWFTNFLAKGGAAGADIIGYHFYVAPKPPEQMQTLITRVRKIRDKYRLTAKPLWNTETGWTFDSVSLTDEELGSYVARSFLVNWAAGVDRFYWYSWDSTINGLVDVGGLVEKPGAQAFAAVTGWLKGATLVSFAKNSKGIYTGEIVRPGGYRGWIVWKISGTGTTKLPAGARTARTLAGGKDYVAGLATYPVGTAPILIDTAD